MASRTTSGRGRRVIADLGAKGVIAYPALMPRSLLLGDLRLGGRTSVIALDGREDVIVLDVSDAVSVLCNESGEWLMYETDERGFNNPKGAWSRMGIDVAAVGDSFTRGRLHSAASLVHGRNSIATSLPL